MNIINIVLLTDENTGAAFEKYHDKQHFRLCARYYNLSEFTIKASEYSSSLFVIDATVFDKNSIENAVTALVSRKSKYICVCDTAAEGFAFMSRGALDMIVKSEKYSDSELIKQICVRVRIADEKFVKSALRTPKYKGKARSDKIVLIGSSTGGAETVTYILRELPEDMPPIIVAQHMPPVFTGLYAERLNEICRLSVWEARDADELFAGTAYIAPGDHQVRLARSNGKAAIEVFQGEKVNGHAPSVDCLFFSAAAVLGKKAIGVILTGMGKDGAAGLLAMRNAGAFTIGQDKDSCVVYGMPKAAYDMGAVVQQAHYENISKVILNNL